MSPGGDFGAEDDDGFGIPVVLDGEVPLGGFAGDAGVLIAFVEVPVEASRRDNTERAEEPGRELGGRNVGGGGRISGPETGMGFLGVSRRSLVLASIDGSNDGFGIFDARQDDLGASLDESNSQD
jgi:hypothetical protein